MMKIPLKRTPTHPGEILLEDFLKPMKISRQALSEAIHMPYPYMNELIRSERDITPNTALQLSSFFGNSPEFWLNLQQAWQLYMSQTSTSQRRKHEQ
jgi:addiction module HigA family antidote